MCVYVFVKDKTQTTTRPHTSLALKMSTEKFRILLQMFCCVHVYNKHTHARTHARAHTQSNRRLNDTDSNFPIVTELKSITMSTDHAKKTLTIEINNKQTNKRTNEQADLLTTQSDNTTTSNNNNNNSNNNDNNNLL